MPTPANGRFFFEGMPLGNEQALGMHPQFIRAVRGFNAATDNLVSAPIVGAYGYSHVISVRGQHQVPGGDFITWLEEMSTIEQYCARVTREVEQRSAAEHAVLNRRLSRLAWVEDLDVFAVVNAVTNGTVEPIGLGAVRFAFPISGDFNTIVANSLAIGDSVVATEVNVTLPTVGEVAIITAIENVSVPTWIEFILRKPTEFGGTNYSLTAALGNLKVYPAEAVWAGLVFRQATWAAPKNLAEGGDSPQGVTFIFEGAEAMRRRGSSATIESTFNGDYSYGSGPIANLLVYGDGDFQLSEVVPAP